jgi:hypothetical protein
VDLHLTQIVRNLEQCFSFEGDCNGLARIDIPLVFLSALRKANGWI